MALISIDPACLPLCVKKQITFVSKEEIRKFWFALHVEAKNVCMKLDKQTTLLYLVECIGYSYYESKDRLLGKSAKTAVPLVWQFGDKRANNDMDMKQLGILVSICHLLSQTYNFYCAFEYLPSPIIKYDQGFFFVDDANSAYLEYSASIMQKGGERQRLSDINSELFCKDPFSFLHAIAQVIEGVPPSTIDYFSDSFYAEIPGATDGNVLCFWQSLWTHAYWICIMFRAFLADGALLEKRHYGVFRFREFAVEMDREYTKTKFVRNMFWQDAWLKSQLSGMMPYESLIVHRPILRINDGGEFATSFALLGDSINNFIEQQIIIRKGSSSEIYLPENLFRKLVSKPFEDEIVNILREEGFCSGNVNEKGVWDTQKGKLQINNTTRENPGEIDILAYNERRKHVFIVECKVLLDVMDEKTIRNLFLKLTEYDSEEFRRKLLRKASWVQESDLWRGIGNVVFEKVILTDISYPFKQLDSDSLIMHKEEFVKRISKLG